MHSCIGGAGRGAGRGEVGEAEVFEGNGCGGVIAEGRDSGYPVGLRCRGFES